VKSGGIGAFAPSAHGSMERSCYHAALQHSLISRPGAILQMTALKR
jgi:hypothetical protein